MPPRKSVTTDAAVTVETVIGGPFPALFTDADAWKELLTEYITCGINRWPNYRASVLRSYLIEGDVTAIRRDFGARWQPSVIASCARLLRAICAERLLPVMPHPTNRGSLMTTTRPDRTERVKGRDTFYSHTMWLLDDWILEVRYGSFQSSDDADDFSASDLALGYNQCLWLHHPYGTSPISYDDIRIFRRVDHAGIQSSPLTVADLQRVADVSDMVCIAQTFGKHAQVRGENVVEIDFSEHALELGIEIPANDDADSASHNTVA
jgi:hypothetical protein